MQTLIRPMCGVLKELRPAGPRCALPAKEDDELASFLNTDELFLLLMLAGFRLQVDWPFASEDHFRPLAKKKNSSTEPARTHADAITPVCLSSTSALSSSFTLG